MERRKEYTDNDTVEMFKGSKDDNTVENFKGFTDNDIMEWLKGLKITTLWRGLESKDNDTVEVYRV